MVAWVTRHRGEAASALDSFGTERSPSDSDRAAFWRPSIFCVYDLQRKGKLNFKAIIAAANMRPCENQCFCLQDRYGEMTHSISQLGKK